MEFNIPLASEVSAEIEKNIKSKDNAAKQSPDRKTEHQEFLKKASDKYTEIIMGICSDAIKSAIKGVKTRTTLRELSELIQKESLNIDGKYIPYNVLHYGHRADGYWTHRTKLEVESGFIVAQRKLKKLGYYLLDESDPNKSFAIFINLYFTEPDPTRTLYNKTDVWHGLNCIPKDDSPS